MKKNQSGFTLIELIIVIAILAILLIIGFMSWRNQFDKAKDADRKNDLQRLSIAFEDYYNDHDCYPTSEILQNCESSELQPYLQSVPCDPLTRTCYCYLTDGSDCPQDYRLLSSLDNTADPAIITLQCHGELFCGWEPECATSEQSGYNYGVSSLNVPVLNPDVTPPPPDASTAPAPSAGPGTYACDPTGVCNSYSDPEAHGCPVTFDDNTCNNACDNPANWCES
jgi:prepilin-type N-terminal cleavage/methylation domain-containing protein